ncbi:MAG: carbohydrate binding domain-containing protein, partial [Armatimonadetes bacterium]|nr:carbohydrate binding domain-containing protein [Armatimonadota bacterium]
MRCLVLTLLLCGVLVAQTNLVPNGDFERDENGDGIPDFWSVAGAPHVKQQLVRDVGRDSKGFSGKLVCTEFGDGTPASHAMICQVGTVGVQRGRWYRLSFWAKAEGIRTGMVRVALVNTRVWGDVGLQDVFAPTSNWQRYEFFFQATSDLLAKESRLQIWFNSTGTLWLDDVELVEIPALNPKRLPQIPTEGIVNFLPNSSFECGTAGWGSYSPDLRWWMGNVFQLIGELDGETSVHGKFSLRISLDKRKLPTFYFDWFDPIRQPVRSLLAAHHGWISVNRNQPYTLSAFMKSDRNGTVGILFVRQSDGRSLRKDFPLTTQWQRFSFTFTPQSDFIWVGAGFDLTKVEANVNLPTIRLDAIQLERGNQPSGYRLRRPIEVMASTDALGNIFVTESSKPTIAVKIHAFADATEGKGQRGQNSSSPTEVGAQRFVNNYGL